MSSIKKFEWKTFYMNLADKLLYFKANRLELISILEDIYKELNMKYPFIDNGENMRDICPFTVFGCFNKGITNKNRIAIMEELRTKLNIAQQVPTTFEGIPVLNNMKAWFFAYEEDRNIDDINNLWKLFEIAISFADDPTEENKSKFISSYEKVRSQIGIKWNITIGLFWIRPDNYLNLDSRNRELLSKDSLFSSNLEKEFARLKDVPNGEYYLNLVEECKKYFMSDNAIIRSFPELSYTAWIGEDSYWPSLSEYNPGIDSEKWIELLSDPTVCTPPMLQILSMYIELGGEATCAKLSKLYGNTPSYYIMMGTNFADNVRNKVNCPICPDGEKNRVFPIVFTGRYIIEDDKKRYSWKLRKELVDALYQIDLPKNNARKKDIPMLDIEKNTILYGPPGTGKTYHTVLYAVAIIENKSIDELILETNKSYPSIIERYKLYKNQGLIEFTTFHQSYGYEEFIEGIKPVMTDSEIEDSNLSYKVVPGSFKAFCERAMHPVSMSGDDDLGMNKNPTIWKVSLEGTGDNDTRTECLSNNHIRIGWDEYGEDITDEIDFSLHGGKNVLNAFINKMKIGDIVLSCYSASTIDAIGVVTGDYEWHDEYKHYKRLRKVNWLVKNINYDIVEMNNGSNMTLSSVYKLSVSLPDVLTILNETRSVEKQSYPSKTNFVYIIDEINRGNISKIFGELITLIEPSKRLGQLEELTVRLPYQDKPFGVPENIYIIGTMNTADRSIALIDTALRRRFNFVEIQPDPSVLSNVNIDGLNISIMLKKMNERISVLYDREHTIGHAYFMSLTQDPSIEKLAFIFENSILPLLSEYFYDDYEKIRLVLGDNQKPEEIQIIKSKKIDNQSLFGNAGLDYLEMEDSMYELNTQALHLIDAYKCI